MKTLKGFTGIAAIALLGIAGVIFAFNKYGDQNSCATADKKLSEGYRRSVSFENGNYHVDTSVIRKNLNKPAFVADIKAEELEAKNSVKQIPDFIKSFLYNITVQKKI